MFDYKYSIINFLDFIRIKIVDSQKINQYINKLPNDIKNV